MRLLTCLLLLLAVRSYSQSFNWTRDFKTDYDTYCIQVLADVNGNTYVVSEYHFTPHHEPSINGCVLRKYDKSGSLQWSIDKKDLHYWKVLYDPNGQLVLFAKENGNIYRAIVDTQNGLII